MAPTPSAQTPRCILQSQRVNMMGRSDMINYKLGRTIEVQVITDRHEHKLYPGIHICTRIHMPTTKTEVSYFSEFHPALINSFNIKIESNKCIM